MADNSKADACMNIRKISSVRLSQLRRLVSEQDAGVWDARYSNNLEVTLRSSPISTVKSAKEAPSNDVGITPHREFSSHGGDLCKVRTE